METQALVVIGVCVCVVVIVVIFISLKTKKVNQTRNTKNNNGNIDYDEEFEKEKAETDKVSISAIKVQSDEDLALLRSMLFSKGVNSFSDFGNINQSVPGLIDEEYSNPIISIFENDIEKAVEIVNDFNEEKDMKSSGNKENEISGTAEIIIPGWKIGQNGKYEKQNAKE